MEKIVIFTGNPSSHSVRKGIVEIVNNYPEIQLLIIHYSPRKLVNVLFKNQWINVKKHGWRWISYQANDIYGRILKCIFPEKIQSNHDIGRKFEWGVIKKLANIKVVTCNNLQDDEILEKIRMFQPDLGISLAAPILRPSIFTIPLLGTINLHKGKVPFYRGMPPAFWELWNGEVEVGCTIHKVEQGLDVGDVLIQSTILVSRFSTVNGIKLALDEKGVLLIVQAIDILNRGEAIWKKQQLGGETYRKPTLKQESILQKRLQSPSNDHFIKYLIKELMFFAYCYLFRPIPSAVLAMQNNQRVNVILYHRVNDDFRDSVTVGIEQFDKQIAIIKKSYTVVSIEEIINGNIPRNTFRPLIAVTFDDGYLDNYENAVPILLKHQIPAAFFISTGMMGSQNGFAHDLSKLGKALPNMNWQQIKQMKELGFTIGSHTVTHINCAKEDLKKVREEMFESKKILEEKINLKNVIFAYPFGKKEDMNSEALGVVKQLGYSGCLSAYGGRNERTINPYNVLRMGIDSNFTSLSFKARLEGYTS